MLLSYVNIAAHPLPASTFTTTPSISIFLRATLQGFFTNRFFFNGLHTLGAKTRGVSSASLTAARFETRRVLSRLSTLQSISTRIARPQ